MNASAPQWSIASCDPARAQALAAALGVERLVAETLVRRGLGDPAAARAFLELDGPVHDPFLLGDMEAACERLARAVDAGERICVHGDYDADGIAATALALVVLRELGANVGWHLPSRFDEGYGLALGTLERLAGEGVALVLTVDCGVTAVEQVARARELGVDVIVTDHHQPGELLPECPRVCTRPSAYPFPELCGTGVVYKLAQALFLRCGRDPAELERHLDLVALATVADVVPLVDENRGLVRAGLRRLAQTARPGLRELMAVARVDRARLDASAVAFRLAPRINAAGRLCRPVAALELLLTDDRRRARELAGELESLNRERQEVEEGILRDALAQVEGRPASWRERRCYVLSSPHWHEGVIGIVASRLVERYGRPVVLVAEGDEEAKGSGRSVPAFDLHAGLAACAGHLRRFGGHRAAAGLTLATEDLDAFADALAAHAAGVLDPGDLVPRRRIDAVAAPAELSLELADAFARLGPFGLGNPEVTLLAPAASVDGVTRTADGRHLRLTVALGGFRCRAIGFRMGELAPSLAGDRRFDVAYGLERNEWNGAVAPQMVLRAVAAAPQAGPALVGPRTPAVPPRVAPLVRPQAGIEDLRGGGRQIASIARLIAAGANVLVLVADVARRSAMLRGALDPGRLGGRAVCLLDDEAGGEQLAAALAGAPQAGTVALAGYRAAALLPGVFARFPYVVALDPPTDEEGARVLAEAGASAALALVWGPAEVEFARSVAELREPLRPALALLWRAARAGAEAPLPAGTRAACAAVLHELGLDPRAAPAGRVELAASPTYAAARARFERTLEFLAALGERPPAQEAPALAAAS